MGCGDVWNQGPDDHDENFVNDYAGETCEDELGRRYTTPETLEERRRARLAFGAAAHEALTTTRGVRGTSPADRAGEPPCPTCDAIDREAAALRSATRARQLAAEFSDPAPFDDDGAPLTSGAPSCGTQSESRPASTPGGSLTNQVSPA